jgi:hypothetical protein
MHTTLGIPHDRLPQTFKDAIHVADKLGFRWLWIDALCICQDSQIEKMREIKKMNVTFKHSTLTIFAVAGNDAEAGLTRVRDPRWVKPCKITVGTTVADSTVRGETFISLDGMHRATPLFKRGWYVIC